MRAKRLQLCPLNHRIKAMLSTRQPLSSRYVACLVWPDALQRRWCWWLHFMKPSGLFRMTLASNCLSAIVSLDIEIPINAFHRTSGPRGMNLMTTSSLAKASRTSQLL
jgi:hypothetical protein